MGVAGGLFVVAEDVPALSTFVGARRRVQKIGRFADFTQATWAYGAGWGKSADFLYSVQLQGLREACALGVGD